MIGTVKRMGIQSAVVGLLAIASAFVPYVNALSPQLAYAAIKSATALAVMFAVDVAWQGIVTSFAASDGTLPWRPSAGRARPMSE